MMGQAKSRLLTGGGLLALCLWCSVARAETESISGPYIETYAVTDGYISVELWTTPDLEVTGQALSDSGGALSALKIIDSNLGITRRDNGSFSVRGELQTEGSFVLDGNDGAGVLPLTVGDFEVSIVGDRVFGIDQMDFRRDVFEGTVSLEMRNNKLLVSGPLSMGLSVADMLGNSGEVEVEGFGQFTAELDIALVDRDRYVEPVASAERTAKGGCVCAPTCGASSGYDVAVCSLQEAGPFKWGASGSIMAYSIPTTSMNRGTQILPWNQCPSLTHPAIPQSFYRYLPPAPPARPYSTFEQIGMSWLKHGFCALQQNSCLIGCSPSGGGCPPSLGIGCTDPYTGSRNGQTNLGPHYTVNPWTGVFACQYGGTGGTIGRRIQVEANDLNPALNSGAQYFGEATYIHQLDAGSHNNYNNASYRRFLVGGLSGGAYTLTWTGSTICETPALEAWRSINPTVRSSKTDLPGEGRFWLYWLVSDNDDGTWHYEYALYNQNSDKAAGSFSVPLSPGVQITNIGFHDVRYHSGDAWDSDTTADGTDNDWQATVVPGTSITWNVPEPFSQNPNSNALRYATVYNFRFDANSPESPGVIATIGAFKTPATTANITTQGPSEVVIVCPADLTEDGDINADDLAELLANWGPCVGCPADLNGDDAVDAADLAALLAAWGPCI